MVRISAENENREPSSSLPKLVRAMAKPPTARSQREIGEGPKFGMMKLGR